MQFAVTLVYYGLALFFAAALVRNFVKSRDLQKGVLYLLVLMPFVMRLFRLK